ncbi:MAG TPA: hypothetical protein VN957_13430 [Chthoniobacterales bacterium]|jgi:hypothetical protein|nr:hypothetical protein [Chthoniobacterales bacterium]
MRKINIKDITEESWTSPKGKFAGASKEISVALGRKPIGGSCYYPDSKKWSVVSPGAQTYPL